MAAPKPLPGLEGLNDAELREIGRRRELVRAWETIRQQFRAADQPMAAADAAFLAAHPGLSLRTLYRWDDLSKNPDPRALLDGRSMAVRAGPREPGPAAWKRFLQFYLTRQCRTVCLCHRLVAAQALQHGRDPDWYWPGYRRVCEKIVKDLSNIQSDYYRLGEREWTRRWGQKIRRDYSQYRAGEIWISDFHDCDTFCRRSETDPRIVRPKMCTFSDLRTRLIVGWRIVTAENQDAVLLTFRDGVQEWGPPREAIIDNGKPYRAKGVSGGRPGRLIADENYVRSVFGQLDVKVDFSIPYNPDSKPIERWHGTYELQFGATFASYCGGDNSHPRARAAYELARKHPELCPTVAQYAAKGEEYIEAFNRTPHRGEGMQGLSPIQAFAKFDPIPKAVAKPGVLDMLLMRLTRPVRVTRFGVRFLNVEYGANDQQLFMLQGGDVLLRVDPQDASYVVVCDLQGHPILKAYNNRLALNEVTRDNLDEAIRKQRHAKKLIKQMSQGEARAAMQDVTDLAIKAQLEQAREHEAATGTYDAAPRNIRPLRSDFADAAASLSRKAAPIVPDGGPRSLADVDVPVPEQPEIEPLSLADLEDVL